MGNASKALLMAGGILLGILILTLMITLFTNSKSISNSYEETKKAELIQQFNVNFTKYLGEDLTIHQVLTIYNFAKENGFEDDDIIRSGTFNLDSSQISKDLKEVDEKYKEQKNSYPDKSIKVEIVYKMEISDYNGEGYISKIKFSNRNIKVTE